MTAAEQIAGRLDAKAVKAFFGDGYFKFAKAIVSTMIRIKAATGSPLRPERSGAGR